MTFSGKNFTFNLGERTYIMGILNVTADSFADGGKYNSPQKAKERVREMLTDGADIIDIGAQSTRPDSIRISAEEEIEILKNYLPMLSAEFNCVISVDTYYPQVAEFALKNGASIINDVSGSFNVKMAELVKEFDCGWIIMHTGGGDANAVPEYKKGVTESVITYFDDAIKKCDNFDISHSRIMLDTGIGFGKNYEHNLEIIKSLNKIKRNDVALLTALSLKRVVGIATGDSIENRVYGTISANTLAIAGGTDFIRVHNIKEAVSGAKMADAVLRG